jgi:hypothetical protein
MHKVAFPLPSYCQRNLVGFMCSTCLFFLSFITNLSFLFYFWESNLKRRMLRIIILMLVNLFFKVRAGRRLRVAVQRRPHRRHSDAFKESKFWK